MDSAGTAGIKSEYISGICNIGKAERRVRQVIGWLGMLITIALWVIFIITKTPLIWRLFVALPAGMSATGFLQSTMHFCVGYGLKGVYNFRSSVGKTDDVPDVAFRKKDNEKALLILFLSVLTGVGIGLGAFLIPI